jgi:hypothetical protein
MIYISAQPDTPYYHWQLEVQLHNFAKFGIDFQYIILLGYQDVESAWAKKMKDKGYQIHTFKDERVERGYIPSIRPFLQILCAASNRRATHWRPLVLLRFRRDFQ